MDGNTLVTLIGSLGFPIVACVALFRYMAAQRDQHAEESREMREAINQLRIAVTELTAYMKGGTPNER